MAELIHRTASIGWIPCSLVTIIGILFAIQLMITGTPTHVEYSAMGYFMRRMLLGMGTMLLLAICAVWSLLISISVGVSGK